MVNIIPLGAQVLIKPLPRQERTTGGLIIPSVVNNDLEEGEVIAIASAVINVKPGDKVLYSSRTGVSLQHESVNYKFLSGPTEKDAGDIKAII
jgi:chaperonin GroES